MAIVTGALVPVVEAITRRARDHRGRDRHRAARAHVHRSRCSAKTRTFRSGTLTDGEKPWVIRTTLPRATRRSGAPRADHASRARDTQVRPADPPRRSRAHAISGRAAPGDGPRSCAERCWRAATRSSSKPRLAARSGVSASVASARSTPPRGAASARSASRPSTRAIRRSAHPPLGRAPPWRRRRLHACLPDRAVGPGAIRPSRVVSPPPHAGRARPRERTCTEGRETRCTSGSGTRSAEGRRMAADHAPHPSQ